MKTELLTLSQEGLDSTRATVTPSESAPQVGDTVPALLAKLHTALGLLVPGSTALTHAWEETGLVGSFRYDSDNQTLYMRQPNDATRQQFTVNFADFITAGVFNQDVLLFAALTHAWTMSLFVSGLVDADGLWIANTNILDDAAATLDSFLLGDDAETDITALFSGSVCTPTFATVYNRWEIDITALIDVGGNALEDLDVWVSGPVIGSVISLGQNVATVLDGTLGANYTVSLEGTTLVVVQDILHTEAFPDLGGVDFTGLGTTLGGVETHTLVQIDAAEITLTVTGTIGRYPAISADWVKTFDGGATVNFTAVTPLGTLTSAAAPATEIGSVLGQVDGLDTSALNTGSNVWAIAQGIGSPVHQYVSKDDLDDVRAFVGDTSKDVVIPSAGSGLLAQWVGWAVFNIFP